MNVGRKRKGVRMLRPRWKPLRDVREWYLRAAWRHGRRFLDSKISQEE
jgi:3-methyladenine DNA glycosylase/8-oxoguanine DNA glycosylase